jgi:hypothetical protein
VILLIWLASRFAMEVRFDWRKKRREELEWDHVRNQWLLDMEHDERRSIYEDRHDTEVLDLGGLLQHHRGEDVPKTSPYHEAVTYYQKEQPRERPQRTSGGRKVRR